MRRLFACLVTALTTIAGLVAFTLPAAAIAAPTVRITPGASTVVVGATRQLTATVTNLADTSVIWSVRSGPGTGSVSATGLYTPPASPPPNGPAIVRATSVQDNTVFGEASVTVMSGVAGGGLGSVRTVSGGSFNLATGDINGDGIADIVRLQNLNRAWQSWDLVTMISDGHGGFTTKTTAVGSGANPVTVISLSLGDVDTDGDLDAIVSIEDSSSSTAPLKDQYQIYRNDGTGTLAPDPVVTAYADRPGGRASALVDWDGDGHLDLVTEDVFGDVIWQRGDGTGSFGSPVQLFSVRDGRYFAVGDVTGDGRPDVVVGAQTSTYFVENTFTVGTNDGFGGIAGTTSYSTGTDPRPVIMDVDGDGWNDVVVSAGQLASASPPNVLAFRNLGTGDGGLDTTPVTLLPGVDAQDLTAVDANGDGMLDLAGVGLSFGMGGPFLATRTGPATFTARQASSGQAFMGVFADFDGDGRVDAFTSTDTDSKFWPGSADTSLHFAVDPTVTRVDATLSTDFSATVLNDPAPLSMSWSATRGSFDNGYDAPTYTAPASASPSGTPVQVTASLTGTSATATRDITIVNDQFEFTSLGSKQVRAITADPADANSVYAATDAGVFRSTNGGATFSQVGTTTTTGTNAQALTLVRDDGAGVEALIALFGTTPYRYDLNGSSDWAAGGGGSFTTATSIASVPGSQIVYASSGGAVWRSTDASATWTSVGGTGVTSVVPIDATTFWAVRSSAPRVETGAVTGGSATFTDRSTPYPNASVKALAVDPSSPGTAYLGISQAGGVQMLRGDAGTGVWTDLPTPVAADRIAVSSSGDLLASVAGSTTLLKSVDDGATWYSVERGFAGGISTQALAFRSDGLALVGTSSGLYTPVDTTPPAAPSITGGPTGTTAPGGANSFAFTFTSTGSSNLCELDSGSWASCSGTATYSGPLSDGSHTFQVVAVDDHGDESTPATRTWTVDATPPAPPSNVLGPPALAASTQAQFTWDLPADATGATCSLDNATPATSCSSGQTYTVGQGDHTFDVRAVDAYGNVSDPVTVNWSVDSIAPEPYIYGRPEPVTSHTYADFTWATEPNVSYACQLDKVTVTCSAAGYSVSGLTEKQHVFDVTATDPAGNQGSSEYTWTVDLTPPNTPTITVHPGLLTNATTADFSFTSDSPDVMRYLCGVDGGNNVCSDTASYPDLKDGQHTFDVSAQDYAGNISQVASFTWKIDATAPEVTIAPAPSSLQPALHASFSEPVAGVDTSAVQLHVTGSAAAVAAAVTCRDGSGVTTPCAGDSVREAVLTPTTTLMPGQHYTFDVSGLSDAAGNEAAPASADFTAPTTLQETSVAARPGWRRVNLSSARGGSYTVAQRKGASATYSFAGTSVTWYAITGRSFGTANVYLDGVSKGKVNLYSSSAGTSSHSFTVSTAGPHTLRIVVRGEKGATHGTGTMVSVDAFKAGGTIAKTPTVSYAWQRVTASAARGGGYAIADLAGATFTVTFRGTGISWTTVTGAAMGKASVQIDRGTSKTFDQWSSSTHYGVVRSFTGLADGVHTLTITVLGKHRSTSHGNAVAVDQLVVHS